MISSAITSLIGDTLICIDDIERLSRNLDIKDVMGLVNHLSLEKNCKVIVVLHEGKANEEFKEYKEKVFDDVLVLDDSLSIIKNIIADNELFPIYENFYQTMGIKNLRFYQRVKKTLKAILDNSDDDLSFTSKKQILEALLIIRMAYDMPSTFDSTIDFDFFMKSFNPHRVDELRGYELDLAFRLDENRFDDEEKVEVARKFKVMDDIISQFYNYLKLSGWSEVITNLLLNLNTEVEVIEALGRSDKLTEAQLENDREKEMLMIEHHSLNPNDNFNQRLFDNAKQRTNRETLSNLSFCCNTLRQNGAIGLSTKLKDLVERHIETKVAKGPDQWLIDDWYFRGPESYDIFYNFLKQEIVNQGTSYNINIICEIFLRYAQTRNYKEELFKNIQNIDKADLRAVIWQCLDNEKDRIRYIREVLKYPAFSVYTARFDNKDRIDTVIWHFERKLDNQKLSPFTYQTFRFESKLNEVKEWTLELLQERIVSNPNSKAAIENWLTYSDNLKNLNS